MANEAFNDSLIIYDYQEIFDKVYIHLLKQGGPSLQEIGERFSCAYRGVNGTMCAIGCLIPDDRYKPSMEGLTVASMEVYNVLVGLGIIVNDDDKYFLCRLQKAHDAQLQDSIEAWKVEMGLIAFQYSLHIPKQ